MQIAYIDKKFKSDSLYLIARAQEIVEEYQDMNFRITVRQLYYQLVSRDYIPNSDKSYKRLVGIIGDARLAGLISWEALEDRTRNLRGLSHWDNPRQVMKAARNSYRRDKWEGQDYLVEVWVEKEALSNVVGRVCDRLDVPYIACRGYMSLSEMWEAGQRFARAIKSGQSPIIIHLGDHDPSGVDMTRDIRDRLNMFVNNHVNTNTLEVHRIALNMEQIEDYNPPPNPAKVTDSRADDYIKRYGRVSWELDALRPDVLDTLITDAVLVYRDDSVYDAVVKREKAEIAAIDKAINGIII
jgi:hypothetical protein